MYGNGLTPASIDETGAVLDQESYGYNASFGVVGVKPFRRSQLSVNYQGGFRHFARTPHQDGIDQTLAINYVAQASQRTTYSLTQAAGTYSRAVGLGGIGGGGGIMGMTGFGVLDPTLGGVPTDDIFDTRTYYSASGGDVSYKKTARWSWNGGGTAYFIRRRASGLAGVNGYIARGDTSYQLSRTRVVGVGYNYMRQRFNRGFGSADAHATGVNFGQRLGRRWYADLQLNVIRVEIQRLEQVQLDPVVAALLGQQTATEVFHGTYSTLGGGAALTGTFRKSSMSFGAVRGVAPGNGVLLTSLRDIAFVTYRASLTGRWSLGLSTAYSSIRAISQNLDQSGFWGTGSTSYRVTGFMHVTAGYGIRQVELNTGFRRTGYQATLGLSFAPGEIPLMLW
jgi:hypothetical protein